MLIAAQREGDGVAVTGGLRGALTIAMIRAYDEVLTETQFAQNFNERAATFGREPIVIDRDGDGLGDEDEVARGTNPDNPDSDGDSISDGAEVDLGTDPLDADSKPSEVILNRTPTGDQDWSTPGVWSNGEAPSAANQYSVVDGAAKELISPKSNSVFGGASLTMLQGTTLGLRARVSEVAKLILNGGGLRVEGRGLRVLGGGLEVRMPTTIALGDGSLRVQSGVVSEHPLTITQRDPLADPQVFELAGKGNEITGQLTARGALLRGASVGALGTGGIRLENGGLDVDYNMLLPNAVIELVGTNFELVLDQTLVFKDLIGFGEDGNRVFSLIELAGAGEYTVERLINEIEFSEDQVTGTEAGKIVLVGDTGDGDADGLWDAWETEVFGGTGETGEGDKDGDGLSNADEFRAGADPTVTDSDGDGLNDGDEVNLHGSSPNAADSDGDTIADGDEVGNGTDPSNADTDADDLTDDRERDLGTDPNEADTDGDGARDGFEVLLGTDPNDADSVPDVGEGLQIWVDVRDLDEGPVNTVGNRGLLTGDFVAGEGTDPEITRVEGIASIEFDGDDYFIGPNSIPELEGGRDGPRTVEAWVFNPDLASEEAIISWGHRGGPNGSNFGFHTGNHADYGAVGHWGGAGPDLGWDGRHEAGQWEHLLTTFDGTIHAVYVNGEKANEEDLSGWPMETKPDLTILLGTEKQTEGLSDLRIWASFNLAVVKAYSRHFAPEEVFRAYCEEASAFGHDGCSDPESDDDGDGLTNGEEREIHGTDPNDPDTDGDGINDFNEVMRRVGGVAALLDPTSPDSDGDGLLDGVETNTGRFVSESDTGTDPLNPDTDGGGLADGTEVVVTGGNPHEPADDKIVDPNLLISIDAGDLPAGPIESFLSGGSVTGAFVIGGNSDPVVEVIDGVRGITFDGDDWFLGPVSTEEMNGGDKPRTVEAWVYNPALAGEETIISWGKRGGPAGSNFGFHTGNHPDFGAVGHWGGGGPDLSWNDVHVAGQWEHLLSTYDGQNHKVYVNGVLANEEDLSAWAMETHPDLEILLGAEKEGSGVPNLDIWLSATVAKVRVHARAFSDSAVKLAHYLEAEAFGQQTTPPADLIVSLGASQLEEGPIGTWSNGGAIGGNFTATGDPEVTVVEGRKGVTFDGTDWFAGPSPPDSLLGNSSRTVTAWVYNPDLASEETVFAWGRRGGPEGSNVSFNHGFHNNYGAVGHWGGGTADIGWNPDFQAEDEAPNTLGDAKEGEWTFIAYTYDGDETLTRVYTNGLLSNEEDISVHGATANGLATWKDDDQGNPLPFLIGNQNEPNGSVTPALAATMTIAKINVFSRVLSQSELAAIYFVDAVRSGAPPPPPLPPIVSVGSLIPATNYTFSVRTEAATQYRVEFSTTLEADGWTTVGTIDGDGSRATFADTDTARLANRVGFYRVVILE